MKKTMVLFTVLMLLFTFSIFSRTYLDHSGKLKIHLVIDPYSDSRTGPKMLKGPGLFRAEVVSLLLKKLNCTLVKESTVKMPRDSEREYGEWNRASITNRTLGKMIYTFDKGDNFLLGLLSGSKSLTGILSGLQHLGPGRSPLKDSRGRDIDGLIRRGANKPLKVGLIWIDSQGAFNTPDITQRGDMDGMNVAVAAGICNQTLRLQAGLDPPLSTKHIVMAGLQSTDPLEQHAIDNSFIETLSLREMSELSGLIDIQMQRLSKSTDIIYVHVDLSVLAPSEIPGHPDSPSTGISSHQLASCLNLIFHYPKTSALGLASFPEEPKTITFQAVSRIIKGALSGIKNR